MLKSRAAIFRSFMKIEYDTQKLIFRAFDDEQDAFDDKIFGYLITLPKYDKKVILANQDDLSSIAH